MALTDDYEPIRSSLLHQTPLPNLEDALSRLKSEETRLGLTHLKPEKAFAVTDKRGKVCHNCNHPGHILPDCPSVECRKCKQKGHTGSNCTTQFCNYYKIFGHLIATCPTRPPRPDQYKFHPRSSNFKSVLVTAAAANETSTNTSYSSSPPISPSNIQSLLKQRHLFSSLFTTTSAPSVHTTDGSLMHDRRTGKIIRTGCKVGRLFQLQNLHIPSTTNLCGVSPPSTFSLLHRRLAHSSLEKCVLLCLRVT
ncbi:hypothetical protein PIB30_028130 [Stylosanthes scabra]|uniref:CCHC-type domain-containing protein n=1 Tax=Stylosanthes scabra TaxID=79078 RepID=A0ABU6V8Z4_9FABA|nr:hypothetical protein [Stylosanthes scabra]